MGSALWWRDLVPSALVAVTDLCDTCGHVRDLHSGHGRCRAMSGCGCNCTPNTRMGWRRAAWPSVWAR